MGLDGERLLLQKNMNGMWLVKQCMDAWAAEGSRWEIGALCEAARTAPLPELLLDVDDPELLRISEMPGRINAQLIDRGASALDESSDGAPAMASLIFRSLAARYAELFQQLDTLTGKSIRRIYIVGGGSRNAFLRELTAAASGKEVLAGSAESSTVGNFALQLAALAGSGGAEIKRALAEKYAVALCDVL